MSAMSDTAAGKVTLERFLTTFPDRGDETLIIGKDDYESLEG